ncbi:MAG: hypothetical protein GKR99_18120 [Rhodobacteraceae bacterium]|nr:hypothetical protein [Paracoccaceae bacterium]
MIDINGLAVVHFRQGRQSDGAKTAIVAELDSRVARQGQRRRRVMAAVRIVIGWVSSIRSPIAVMPRRRL